MESLNMSDCAFDFIYARAELFAEFVLEFEADITGILHKWFTNDDLHSKDCRSHIPVSVADRKDIQDFMLQAVENGENIVKVYNGTIWEKSKYPIVHRYFYKKHGLYNLVVALKLFDDYSNNNFADNNDIEDLVRYLRCVPNLWSKLLTELDDPKFYTEELWFAHANNRTDLLDVFNYDKCPSKETVSIALEQWVKKQTPLLAKYLRSQCDEVRNICEEQSFDIITFDPENTKVLDIKGFYYTWCLDEIEREPLAMFMYINYEVACWLIERGNDPFRKDDGYVTPLDSVSQELINKYLESDHLPHAVVDDEEYVIARGKKYQCELFAKEFGLTVTVNLNDDIMGDLYGRLLELKKRNYKLFKELLTLEGNIPCRLFIIVQNIGTCGIAIGSDIACHAIANYINHGNPVLDNGKLVIKNGLVEMTGMVTDLTDKDRFGIRRSSPMFAVAVSDIESLFTDYPNIKYFGKVGIIDHNCINLENLIDEGNPLYELYLSLC